MRAIFQQVAVPGTHALSWPHCATQKTPDHQQGTIAIMMVAFIPVILGLCAFAIDLGMMYNRKIELQKAADSMALAAAAQLDGTTDGITRAVDAAKAIAITATYGYKKDFMAWSDNAISFASGPGGGWSSTGDPKNLFYVKVDTSEFDARVGKVATFLIQALAPGIVNVQVSGRAIAARSSINVTPLAVCAMSDLPDEARGTELVEYGFRRGVSYNLMRLNRDATTPAVNFLVNPFAPPGVTGTSVISKVALIQPFICTGSMAIPGVTGDTITVERNFPLSSFYTQFNSRFSAAAVAGCNSTVAPQDSNIKQYPFAALSYMNTLPTGQGAAESTVGSKLRTVADLPSAQIPSGTNADKYGPLWLYSKPIPVSGAAFTVLDWPTLYPTTAPAPLNNTKIKSGVASNYPSASPYLNGGALWQSTVVKGVKDRRVLNIPLLECSTISAGSPATAKVVGVGKFFMTVPATSTDLYAEFAGLAQPQSLGGTVELLP